MFLEISQNLYENTCARVTFLIKLSQPAFLLRKRLWHRSFPVNFAELLRIPFLQNTSGRLLLSGHCFIQKNPSPQVGLGLDQLDFQKGGTRYQLDFLK